MKQAVFILVLLIQYSVSQAHDFYEGLTRISYNEKTTKLEIVHRFATHDLVEIIAKLKGKEVSAKQRKFPLWVKQYFIQNFSIWNGADNVNLTMIGAEPGETTTVVYQIVEGINQVNGLTIENNLFIKELPKQINLLNYQDANIQGTLIFSRGDIKNTIR